MQIILAQSRHTFILSLLQILLFFLNRWSQRIDVDANLFEFLLYANFDQKKLFPVCQMK